MCLSYSTELKNVLFDCFMHISAAQ